MIGILSFRMLDVIGKKVPVTGSSSLLYYFDFHSNSKDSIREEKSKCYWVFEHLKINLNKYIWNSLYKSEQKLKWVLADFRLKKKVCSHFLLKDYPSKTASCFILSPEGYPPKAHGMAVLHFSLSSPVHSISCKLPPSPSLI